MWGNLFFLGISAEQLTQDEIKWLNLYGAGGIVLFKRNIKSPEQLKNLIAQIKFEAQKSANPTSPLICIDMEGGRVAELPQDQFKSWPVSPSQISEELLYQYGFEMGSYLARLGFRVNFAPCLDVLTEPSNQLIGDRALSTNPIEVVKKAKLLIKGYQDSGILICAKHFPGHGHTIVDSHFDLPVDHSPLDQIESSHLLPFKLASDWNVPFFMTAHVLYSSVDKDHPATLSEFFLTKILRDKLGYQGLCLADDLDMGALIKNNSPRDIATQFLKAGGDVLMYCHRNQPPFDIYDHINNFFKSNQVLAAHSQLTVLEVEKLKSLLSPL